ncbi:hypothetical protein CPB83DRAFT_845299, partial [Crepidotus variabilis]
MEPIRTRLLLLTHHDLLSRPHCFLLFSSSSSIILLAAGDASYISYITGLLIRRFVAFALVSRVGYPRHKIHLALRVSRRFVRML